MSSPIRLYIVPNCGFELDVKEDLFLRSKLAPDAPFEYTVCNTSDLNLLLNYVDGEVYEEEFKGWMSPLHKVTLPNAIKKIAGIPKEAAFYAYVYPPKGLASHIDWEEFEDSTVSYIVEAEKENKWAMPFIAGLGGYAYFDQNYNLLCVNTISTVKTNYDLKLSGPFSTANEARDELQSMNRVHPLTSEVFHETGYVSSAWIHPYEKFRFKQATDQYENMHGAFIFYRQDHTATMYCLEPSGFLDPAGESSYLDDAFHMGKTLAHYAVVREHYMPETDVQVQQDMRLICNGASEKAQYIPKIDDPRTLLHYACRAKCDAGTISHLLYYSGEGSNLNYCDKSFGWTPLHFACCFQPNNFELISLLVKRCPKAVLTIDRCDRYPLHIACEHAADETVVELLLNNDTKGVTIHQSTKLLGRLPIHSALDGGCKANVIALLLKRDVDAQMLHVKTANDRLALHIAIEKKLPPDIIELLLFGCHRGQDQTDGVNKRKTNPEDVYEYFGGMLPLHTACWNNSSYETIELLLQKDTVGKTIKEEVGYDSVPLQDAIATLEKVMVKESKDIDSVGSFDGSKSAIGGVSQRRLIAGKAAKIRDRATEYLHQILARWGNIGQGTSFGTTALHLAMNYGNYKVIKLLLGKGKTSERSDFLQPTSNVFIQDHLGRTPLHIATLKNLDVKVISALLKLDVTRETTQRTDIYGAKPIHYACSSADARADVINMLLSAEDRYIDQTNQVVIRSTKCLDGEGRSPLFIALKSNAKAEVIEILLQPEHFTLVGLTSPLKEGLAKMATSKGSIQEMIINKLSDRGHFCLLVVDVYISLYTLTAFMFASEKLQLGKLSYDGPITLSLTIIFFILRELIQIKSQSLQYFSDVWSWLQLVSIGLLSFSTAHMLKHASTTEDIEINKLLLLANGTLLTIQSITILKSTFLPFARFVGGLIAIIANLIPFFVVSSLTLLAFAYSFWMSGTKEDSCKSLEHCFLSVLGFFFSGADDTKDILDILFGIVVIVVLLNVLIAVVGKAWENTTESALRFFWKFRIDFLSESRFVEKSNMGNGFTRTLGDYIDGIGQCRVVDKISWTKEPYNIVTSKDMYDHPSDYFSRQDASIIAEAKSLQADMYWLKKDIKGTGKCLYFHLPFVIMQWMITSSMYVMLVIMGICSAGWCWPKHFRKMILEVGLSSKSGDDS